MFWKQPQKLILWKKRVNFKCCELWASCELGLSLAILKNTFFWSCFGLALLFLRFASIFQKSLGDNHFGSAWKKMGIISRWGIILGSLWGSFRGRDHFRGCTTLISKTFCQCSPQIIHQWADNNSVSIYLPVLSRGHWHLCSTGTLCITCCACRPHP